MTIGPLPMSRIDSRSVRLGHRQPAPGHQVGELVEQVARRRAGPGPASGWYCTLKHAARRRARRPSTTPSLRLTWVTSTPSGERVGVDREVVVLAGDLDPAGRQVAHRVVAAVVAERQLVRCRRRARGRGSGGRGRCRTPAPRRAARRSRRSRTATAAGSPGPFERNTPSGSRASTSAAVVDAGTTSTRQPSAREVAQDRALDPEVVGDDVERRVVVADGVRLVRW